MNKLLFISFCLSLICSPLAYSQQTKNLEQLTVENIQAVAQEIEKLSPQEKIELKESLIETFNQLSEKEKSLVSLSSAINVGLWCYVCTAAALLGGLVVCVPVWLGNKVVNRFTKIEKVE